MKHFIRWAPHPARRGCEGIRCGLYQITLATCSLALEAGLHKYCQLDNFELQSLDVIAGQVLPEPCGPLGSADLLFISPQPETSLYYETADTGLVHRVVCLFTLQPLAQYQINDNIPLGNVE